MIDVGTSQLPASIFEQLGLDNLSDSRKSELLEEMNEILVQRVLLRVQAETGQELSQDVSQWQAALQQVPNADQIVREEVQRMEHQMRGVIDEVIAA